jgi:hypothetical protein
MRRTGILVLIALVAVACGAKPDDDAVPAGPAVTAADQTPTSADPTVTNPTTSESTDPTAGDPEPATTIEPAAASDADRVHCTAVIHLGDSTSQGMVAPTYQPVVADGIDAQYARVGVVERHLEIDPARSIIETHHGSPNARDRAQYWRDQGFHGCWVIAMGTTDAANSGAGSNYDATERINRMMAVAGNDPVLWVNVKTRLTDGAWSDANMQLWNQALDAAAKRYPNMRIFDWRSAVQDNWFQSDGIHYSTAGSAARARMIADSLAEGFPAG